MKQDTRHIVLTLIGIMLVAFNLRPALTSIGPILRNIGASLSLSSVGQGALTTLPVFCLGLAAPLAPWAARRLGMERAVLAGIALLAVSLAVRPYFGVIGLLVGTAIAGGCIGVMGVLLPGIVKRDFPESASLLTGVYTAVLCTGASAAAGSIEPLRLAFGNAWRPALALWMIPAAVAGAAWWPRLYDKQIPTRRAAPATSMFRDALAWQVALYMGLQSSLAYAVYGWLPTILQDRGLNAVRAGLVLSVSIMIQILAALAAPWIASHMRDQRLMATTVIAVMLLGLAGCIYAPIGGVWFWIVALGLGQGGAFSMALTLLAVRARDADTAAQLSGMAQGVGYSIAAFSPLLVGVFHDVFHGWRVAGVFLACIGAAAILAGLGAGRRLYVLDLIK